MLQPIPLSSIKDLHAHRYLVQTQSKSGSWSDWMGTDDLDSARSCAQYEVDQRGTTVRIVDLHQ